MSRVLDITLWVRYTKVMMTKTHETFEERMARISAESAEIERRAAARIVATITAVNGTLAENAARKSDPINITPTTPTARIRVTRHHQPGCECGNYYGPNSQCYL